MKQRRTEIISVVALLCSLLTLTLAFSTTYRVDTPAGTDDPSEGDDRMREAKLATQERLDVDHYWTESAASIYDDPNTGKHRFVTYTEPNNITSVLAGEGMTFTKDTNDIPELHWIDDEDNVLQLTQEGRLYLGTNNVYLRVDNAAGDGYVDLIKADTDDEPVLQDGAALASTADPNEDTDIAHKAYVDKTPHVGGVVQIVNTQTGAYASGNTIIPLDDTIPQITEGTEFMTCAITPTSETNILVIDVLATLYCTNAHSIIGALFQDDTAGALAAGLGLSSTYGYVQVHLHYEMVAGTTSETTFRFRAGADGSNVVGLNGHSSRIFGSVCVSSISVTELKEASE